MVLHLEGGREGGMEGGREGGRKEGREGGRKEGREGGRKKGGREGGREGDKEREGRREGEEGRKGEINIANCPLHARHTYSPKREHNLRVKWSRESTVCRTAFTGTRAVFCTHDCKNQRENDSSTYT